MLRLIRFLRPYVLMILLIFGLLFAQAMADLALPEAMSGIVNVGLQQKGIADAIPEALRTVELDRLLLLVPAADRAAVDAAYRRLDPEALPAADRDRLLARYPILANESVAVWDPPADTDREALKAVLARAIALRQGLASGMAGFGGMGATGSFPSLPEGTDLIEVVEQLPEAQREALLAKAADAMAGLSDSLLLQTASVWIAGEYEACGMDLVAIQNRYILSQGGYMMLLALVAAACTIAVGYLSALVAAGLSRDLRRQVFRKVEGFSSAEFDKFSTASLITRSTNDIQQIQMMLVMLLRILFYAPMMAIGGVVKVVAAQASMTWIIGMAVGALLTLIVLVFTVAMPRFKRIQKLVDKLNLVTREILSGLMVIRAFNTRRREEERFDGVNGELTRTTLFVTRIMVLMMPVMMLIMNGTTLLIVWTGALKIDAGTLQIGDMMAFLQYAMQIIMSFLMVSFVFFMLPRASVSAERIGEVLDTAATILDPAEPRAFPDGAPGRLEFRDVGFRYPGADENVLCRLSFVAEPGKTTAIIGGTGSGKSTIIQLIPRFYDVTEGAILLDGVDIREVRQRDLRARIGYVPQRGILFSGDARSNVAFGRPDASDAEVDRALHVAQASEFVEAHKEGTAMAISQGGVNVSGGQRQRLSIARALAVQPDLFLFDDSFSALDFRTDAALRKALREETASATVLVVAQRIGTILHADRILVLDDGRLVGTGTHRELLDTCPLYREIALSQLSEEELAG